MNGTVSQFDEARGLGEIVAESGATYPFHCTAIVDGSRTIDAGRAVTFSVRPGGMGRWEATAVEPVS